MIFNQNGKPKDVSIADLRSASSEKFGEYINGAICALTPSEGRVPPTIHLVRAALENLFDVAMELVERKGGELPGREISLLYVEHAAVLTDVEKTTIFESDRDLLRIPTPGEIRARDLYNFVVQGIQARLNDLPNVKPETFWFLSDRPYGRRQSSRATFEA